MNIKYFLYFLTFAYNSNIIFSQADLTLDTNTNIHNLKSKIFKNYTFDTIPINSTVPLNVSMGLAIRAFSNIDQKEGTVELNVWLACSIEKSNNGEEIKAKFASFTKNLWGILLDLGTPASTTLHTRSYPPLRARPSRKV